MYKESVKVKALQFCMDGMDRFKGMSEDDQKYFIKVCADTFNDAVEGKSYGKIKMVKARINVLERTLNDELIDEFKIKHACDPMRYEIVQHDHRGELKPRSIATISEFGEPKMLVDYGPARQIINAWKKDGECTVHTAKGISTPMRTAKLTINIDDSKLQKVIKDVDKMSHKLLKVKGFTDEQIKDITNWHILPPSENKHKVKRMYSFDKCKESTDLNDYFVGKGYTVGQAKELCNWYLKTIDNSQKITKYEGD